MASNFSQEKKIDKESSKAGGLTLEDGDSKKQLLSASSTATSKQNGDQAGCEDEQMSEQDASERRKAGLSDLKNCGGSPSTLPRSTEELPRRNFQIPRKIKERKGCVSHCYHYYYATAIPEMHCFCFTACKFAKSSLLTASGKINKAVLISKQGIYITHRKVCTTVIKRIFS